MDSSSSPPARFITRNSEHVAGTNRVEGEQVIADDRAIFLTFSGRYTVSKAELHAYFTRRYGDIIEAIHMGAGGGGDQGLYAMMVLHSAAMIQEIIKDEVYITKFTINGKHVWARKFKS